VGYLHNAWRVCYDHSCKKPTQKTIQPYEPTPVVSPAAPFPTPSIPAPLPPTVVKQPDSMTVHFRLGKAIPTINGAIELTKVLARASNTSGSIKIEGFTDATGSTRLNNRLAKQRAIFVAQWLKRHGVKNSLIFDGKGRCCYVTGNQTSQEQAQNRRTEINFKEQVNHDSSFKRSN
jgi:outer membrane protein OmpA-like peptidoglycan-associated protein